MPELLPHGKDGKDFIKLKKNNPNNLILSTKLKDQTSLEGWEREIEI